MTQGLWWSRSIFRWIFCSSLTAAWCADDMFEHACLFCRAPVSTITHSSFLPTKSSLHEQPLQSSISLLSSLFTLSTLDNSLCTHLSSCLNYLYTFTSPPASLSLSQCVSLSLRAMWAGDPLSPLYPGLPFTWPRADYILDITVPDVYD